MTLLVILLLLILIMITPPVGIIVLIGMELWYFPEVFIPLLVVGLIITVFVWMLHTSGMSAKQEAEENETIRRESECAISNTPKIGVSIQRYHFRTGALSGVRMMLRRTKSASNENRPVYNLRRSPHLFSLILSVDLP